MKKIYLLVMFCFSLCYATTAFAQPGVLDQTFGVNGKVTIPVPPGTGAHAIDIKIQPDQKILVLTRVDTSINNWNASDFFWMYQLWRFNTDGTVDNSFGTNGRTPLVNNERPTSMELLANGKILLNTQRQYPQYPNMEYVDLCLTRYNSNGTIDNTFGTNGSAVTRFDTLQCIAASVFVLPGGKIIQAGFAIHNPPGGPYVCYNVLAGFNQNGSIDPAFGSNGKMKRVTTNLGFFMVLPAVPIRSLHFLNLICSFLIKRLSSLQIRVCTASIVMAV